MAKSCVIIPNPIKQELREIVSYVHIEPFFPPLHKNSVPSSRKLSLAKWAIRWYCRGIACDGASRRHTWLGFTDGAFSLSLYFLVASSDLWEENGMPGVAAEKEEGERDKEPSFDVKEKKRACCNSRHWLYRAFEFIYFSFTRGCRPRIFTLSNPYPMPSLFTLDDFLSLLPPALHHRHLHSPAAAPFRALRIHFKPPPSPPLYRAPLFRT